MTHGKVIVRQNVITVITNKTDKKSVFIGPISGLTPSSTCLKPSNIHFSISTINATLVYSAALEINDSEALNNMKYTFMILYPNLDDLDKPSGSL